MANTYKLKVDATLAEVEHSNGVGLLDESERSLRVWAKGIPREVKVDQGILHVLVLLHAVCQERAA